MRGYRPHGGGMKFAPMFANGGQKTPNIPAHMLGNGEQRTPMPLASTKPGSGRVNEPPQALTQSKMPSASS
jgi:hypothetical protein